MDITKEKADVFGQIAALRVSAEGYPNLAISNSLPSITQATNSLSFLTDLLKALVGFESLKESLVDILTYNLEDIEAEIKKALKKSLKSTVSCSVNPSIPQDFIDNGISLELINIDYLDIFKIDPTSTEGNLIYDDVDSGLASSDFNTYLYNVIQDNGDTTPWGSQTGNPNILDIRFDELPVGGSGLPNNTINVKPTSLYAETKKLPDLNNDFIDSIQLFNSAKLINNIVESLFGVVSVRTDKDMKQIAQELRIEYIVNRIINTDEDIIIDNSYYSFTNEELDSINYRAELKRKGKREVATCGNAESSISFNTINTLNSNLTALQAEPMTPALMEIIATTVRRGIDDLADDSADNVGDEDKPTVKLNFIENMLRQIMTAIVNVLLSPKLVLILAVNHVIVYGEPFKDTEDFMRKNSVLLTSTLQSVRDNVVSVLMDRVLKEIKVLVSDNIIQIQIERVRFKKAQIASLVGIPTDVLRQISGLVS